MQNKIIIITPECNIVGAALNAIFCLGCDGTSAGFSTKKIDTESPSTALSAICCLQLEFVACDCKVFLGAFLC
jgi:hypothetical protein